MKLSDHQNEFAKDFNKLLTFLFKKGCKVTIDDVRRLPDVQLMYYEQGLSKTKRSNHEFKCAVDLNIFINDELIYDKKILQFAGDYWESLNPLNRWGGNFKGFGKNGDSPHFERNIK